MKAKDLAEELLEHPDFDVEFTCIVHNEHTSFPDYRHYKITGITDIGHSDKVIVLDGEER